MMAFDVKNFDLLERDLCVCNIGYCHYSSYTLWHGTYFVSWLMDSRTMIAHLPHTS